MVQNEVAHCSNAASTAHQFAFSNM